jgi:hypothetical protein
MLYGIPLLILFPYTRWRPDAEFQAAVHTEAVDFTVGAYKKAGPFVGGCVDAYFGNFGRVELPGGSPENLWGGKVRFRNVGFRSLFLTAGTQVRMLWYEASPDGVEVILTYKAMPSPPAATVFLTEKSTVEFQGSGFSESGVSQNGLIRVTSSGIGVASIYPQPDLRFPVSVTPCSVTKPAPPVAAEAMKAAGTPQPKAVEKTAALPAADGIALASASAITFFTDDGESAIVGTTNSVQVRNTDRTETLLQGQRLEIAALSDRSPGYPSQISTRIKDGIDVNVLGRAGTLRIDGADARPSPAEYLRARKVLSAWLTTAILLGSALLTIVSRIKLVKLDEKDS